MRTLAVLPVKSFRLAKQRLGAALEGVQREELAAAMVTDVLAALRAVDGLDGVVVVTAEPAAARIGREAGAAVVHDPREAGQSDAAALGVAAAEEAGAERVLLVPGDCPALAPGEVEALLAGGDEGGPADGDDRGERAQITIVPDRHGSGTNALLMAPPRAIAPSFGPGSLARHAAWARATGARVAVAALPSLGLDVDTPGDLAALRAALAARHGGAPRTRAVLERVAPAAAARAASA